MLNQKDLKIAEYLIFNKFLGEPDDPSIITLSSDPEEALFSPSVPISLPPSEELVNKIEKIEKEIREKTFDERIDEFQDERIKQQISSSDHIRTGVIDRPADTAIIGHVKIVVVVKFF